jgi:hypothetical protein
MRDGGFRMAGIKIKLEGSRYWVDADPAGAESRVSAYRTIAPVSIEVAIAVLRSHGWHQTDIGDAFYEADPEWLTRRAADG